MTTESEFKERVDLFKKIKFGSIQSCKTCESCNVFGSFCNLHSFFFRKPSADVRCADWEDERK